MVTLANIIDNNNPSEKAIIIPDGISLSYAELNTEIDKFNEFINNYKYTLHERFI